VKWHFDGLSELITTGHKPPSSGVYPFVDAYDRYLERLMDQELDKAHVRYSGPYHMPEGGDDDNTNGDSDRGNEKAHPHL
jgi:hypothetical protein